MKTDIGLSLFSLRSYFHAVQNGWKIMLYFFNFEIRCGNGKNGGCVGRLGGRIWAKGARRNVRDRNRVRYRKQSKRRRRRRRNKKKI